MPKLNPQDTLSDIIFKLAADNPGALVAINELCKSPRGLSALAQLDALGIYGTSVYVLWNEKCDKDTRRLLWALLLSMEGGIDPERLRTLSQNQMRQEKFTELELSIIDECAATLDHRFNGQPKRGGAGSE